MPLLSSMEGGGNLPHVEKLMTESISSHDRAISFDNKNPLLYTSKASSLCKFHMLDDMIKCTADAERVMMEEADSILNPEQREYVKLQNEKRIELLREVTKLFEEARSFHQAIESYFKAGNTVHFDNSEEIHEGYNEVKIEESRVFSEVSSHTRHGALKRFHDMPSLRQLSGLREANYSFEADIHAEEESVHSPRGSSSAAAGGGGRAGGWEGFRDVEIHGIRSLRPKFDTIRETSDEDEADHDKPHMHMPRVKSHQDKIDAKLLLAAGSEKSTGGMFSPPQESTITSVANAALNPGRVDVSAKSSLKDELARSQKIPEPTSAAEAATLDLASEILERELREGASLDEKEVKKISLRKIAEFVICAKTTIDTVSSPAKSMLELQKQINKTHDLQKQIDFLTRQLEMMQDHFNKVTAIPLVSEDYEHRLDLAEIEKSPALREYYSGFVKTFQTMYMGFITRSSGEVESAKQTIGLSYIPLPPIVDNVVKAFETAVVTGMRIKKDNEATVSLQGVANPLDLMNKVIPIVACKLALNIKKDEIHSYIPEERHGIFKIIEFYDAIKSQVFERMNLTSYAEFGSEDALKLLGAFRSGLVFVQNLSSPKIQAENILRIFTGECFATELELKDADSSDHSCAAAAAGGGGAAAVAPAGSGALILGMHSSGSLSSKGIVDLSKYSKSGDLHSPYSSRATDLSTSRSATTESAAVTSVPLGPEVKVIAKEATKSWWQNFKDKWCCCASEEDIAAARAAVAASKYASHASFKSVVPAHDSDTDEHGATDLAGVGGAFDGD